MVALPVSLPGGSLPFQRRTSDRSLSEQPRQEGFGSLDNGPLQFWGRLELECPELVMELLMEYNIQGK